MLFRLIIFFFFIALRNVAAIDPLAGPFFVPDCFPERTVTGCNQSHADAYAEANNGKVDETPDKPDTRFYLFTSNNKNTAEPLHKCGGRLPENTYYDPKKKTIVFLSGFGSCLCDVATLREMKDQILYRGGYNVILVDWCWAERVDYATSCVYARLLGKHIAFVIKNIVHQTGTSLKKFHFVGISLGAQVMAFIGQCFKNPKIGRLTGLDPAMPGFNVEDVDERLDKSDAEWVDIIHTNGGNCLMKMGDPRPIGHADFYVNGGVHQLNCFSHTMECYMKGDVVKAALYLIADGCFHVHSFEYFKMSINPCDCQYIGVECDNYEDFQAGKCNDCGEDGSKCAVMGLDWELFPRKKGNHSYYFTTSMVCPFCDNSGINLNGFSKLLNKCSPKRHCFSAE